MIDEFIIMNDCRVRTNHQQTNDTIIIPLMNDDDCMNKIKTISLSLLSLIKLLSNQNQHLSPIPIHPSNPFIQSIPSSVIRHHNHPSHPSFKIKFHLPPFPPSPSPPQPQPQPQPPLANSTPLPEEHFGGLLAQ
jgi:hypothetical protein